MKDFRGYVQIYTGNGKGKTTSALGLCLRAIGAGMNIYIAQFMKSGNYSELKALKLFQKSILIEQFGSGKFISGSPSEEEKKIAQKGLASVRKKSSSGNYNIVVMDEANVAITFDLFKISDVLDIIKQKSKSTELIITGRNAHPRIIDSADLVTEMIEIKHYYKKGIEARRGIEK